MLLTLQWYIFREMGKTFLLTSVALTALIGLGGGVMNMIEAEQVTADQLLRIMIMTLPLAVAVTLPIASLFSATVTYGRLSADNELVACRASGINVHRLFLPTTLFSLLSAVVTFYCMNFVIPSLFRQVPQMLGKDNIIRLIQHRLRSPERLAIQDRLVYADDVTLVEGETVDGEHTPDELILTGAVFLERRKDAWMRYGTANQAIIRIDMNGSQPLVSGEMRGVRYYDRRHRQWNEQEFQEFKPWAVPLTIKFELKWRNLSELMYFQRYPAEIPDIKDQMIAMRSAVACASYFASVAREWQDNDGKVRLGDERASYLLASGNLTPDLEDGRPMFEAPVTVRTLSGEARLDYRCRRATLDVRPAQSGDGATVTLALLDGVEIIDPDDPQHSIKKERVDLDEFELPPSVIDEATTFPARYLLDPDADLQLGERVERKHAELLQEYGAASRKIVSLIHSRLALSASPLVLVILGAALGILFRGSHVLTAFGISFIPSACVTVTIIMGRQLAKEPGTVLIGVLVIWAGIAVVAGLDVWVLARRVRR